MSVGVSGVKGAGYSGLNFRFVGCVKDGASVGVDEGAAAEVWQGGYERTPKVCEAVVIERWMDGRLDGRNRGMIGVFV